MWLTATKVDKDVVEMYSRHYSSRMNKRSKKDWLAHGITPPGESLILLWHDGSALFVWLKQKYSHYDGVHCTVFRNEGKELSSDLILSAEDMAVRKWGSVQFYTFIDDSKIKSTNPGYCFKTAGWKLVKENGKPVRTVKSNLLVLTKVKDPTQ